MPNEEDKFVFVDQPKELKDLPARERVFFLCQQAYRDLGWSGQLTVGVEDLYDVLKLLVATEQQLGETQSVFQDLLEEKELKPRQQLDAILADAVDTVY